MSSIKDKENKRYATTFESWNNMALLYQQNFMDISLYNDTYNAFCELIRKPNPKIFEIGCGPGNIANYLLYQRPDFVIYGIDVAPNMIKLAKANNPVGQFSVMDCREISKINDKFDGIVCGFCIPYLCKEACTKLIKDCSLLLYDGGILYASIIEGDYNQSGYETSSDGQHKAYVYYYDKDFIQKTLSNNALELVDLKYKNFTGKHGSTSTHLIFIARKK